MLNLPLKTFAWPCGSSSPDFRKQLIYGTLSFVTAVAFLCSSLSWEYSSLYLRVLDWTLLFFPYPPVVALKQILGIVWLLTPAILVAPKLRIWHLLSFSLPSPHLPSQFPRLFSLTICRFTSVCFYGCSRLNGWKQWRNMFQVVSLISLRKCRFGNLVPTTAIKGFPPVKVSEKTNTKQEVASQNPF